MDGPDDMTSIATLFSRCVALVRNLSTSLSHVRLREDQQLKLYALYKQAEEGDNSTTCPGLLDLVGRAKWNAWKALIGLSKAEAQAQYVACVRTFYGDDAVTSSSSSSTSTPSAPGTTDTAYHSGGGGGGGTSEDNFSFGSNQVRALGAIGENGLIAGSGRRKEGGRDEGGEEDDDEEGEETQDIFLYAKRGMAQEVMARLDEGGKEGGKEVSIEIRDREGRTPLHWAVDGNHQVLVELLLARGADVTVKDGEGETPLDYARLCEHEALVEVLVKWEAAAVGRREKHGMEGEREGDEGKKGVEKYKCEIGKVKGK